MGDLTYVAKANNSRSARTLARYVMQKIEWLFRYLRECDYLWERDRLYRLAENRPSQSAQEVASAVLCSCISRLA